MNNDIAVEILRELWRYKTTDKYTEIEIRRALETAIEAVNGLRPHGEMRLIDANAIQFDSNEFDTYSDYSRAFDAIDQAPTIKTFTLADIEENYRKGLEKGLEESLEERENIISWLSKFCLHIDIADKHLSDAEALEFWKKKMNQQFGWGEGEAE